MSPASFPLTVHYCTVAPCLLPPSLAPSTAVPPQNVRVGVRESERDRARESDGECVHALCGYVTKLLG